MSSKTKSHTPVLLKEAIHALNIQKDAVVLDATFGSGGHSRAITEKLGENGILIALDADKSAIERGERLLHTVSCQTHFVHANFREVDAVCEELSLEKLDAAIADLGWRSEQVLESKEVRKGFSFKSDEPLLMTYGDPHEYAFTARDIVNEWKQEDIANVLYGYGEERYARRIAKRIVRVRQDTPIATSSDLVSIIEAAVPPFYRRKKIHPATKTFQALRIAVNDELTALSEFITKTVSHLKEEGVLAIISFHSIEDRIVKQMFQGLSHDHFGTVITKKPITPGAEENDMNPRARSAKLRIFKKTSHEHHEKIRKDNTIRT